MAARQGSSHARLTVGSVGDSPTSADEARPPSRKPAPAMKFRADELPVDFQRLLEEVQRFVLETFRQELSDFQARARHDLREELGSHFMGLSSGSLSGLELALHPEAASGAADVGLRGTGNAKAGVPGPPCTKTLTEEEEHIGGHDWGDLARRGMMDPIIGQQLQTLQPNKFRHKNRSVTGRVSERRVSKGRSSAVEPQADNPPPRIVRAKTTSSCFAAQASDAQEPTTVTRQVASAGCRQAWQGPQVPDDDDDDSEVENVTIYDQLCEFVHSTNFDYGSGVIVVLNAAVLGAQVDWQARQVTTDLIWPFRVLEFLFCMAFTVELGLRIAVHGRDFFAPAVRKWHVLDVFLVISQILDLIITPLADEEGASRNIGQNLTTLRMVRFLRLMRVTRLVRVLRLIGELRMLVMSILGALKHLSWAVSLLFLLMYIMGVYITQLTLDHRLDNDITRDAVATDKEAEALVFYYGSLGDTILSVYKAVTGGVDWGDILEPLKERISIWAVPAFMMYIAFVVLCMLNVITGVFVESALATAKRDRASVMVSNVKSVFDQYDDNRSGQLDWDEFKAACESKDMKTILASLDIDSSEADGLFHLLDIKETGHVTPAEFAVGCVRLSGNSKALELAILMREFTEFMTYFSLYSRRVDANIAWIVQTMQQQKDATADLNCSST